MAARGRILITGGAGFIGSHVTDAAIAAGYETHVLDNLSTGRAANVPVQATLHRLDIRDAELDALFLRIRPQAVLHLAAQMDVRASVRDPVFDANTNVVGTVRLLSAAAVVSCRTFVFASSGGAVYGEQEIFPAPESHPCRGESPYGVSKRCGELYLDYFGRATSMRTCAMRPANVYGPRQDPHGEAGVVAIFAARLLRGESPIINGDGEQTRDYVSVADVARAFMLALENPEARGPINIGTGVETSVVTLAREMALVCGFRGEARHDAAKPGEQRRSVVDIARAQALLGWAPRVSLADGLRETVESFRS